MHSKILFCSTVTDNSKPERPILLICHEGKLMTVSEIVMSYGSREVTGHGCYTYNTCRGDDPTGYRSTEER